MGNIPEVDYQGLSAAITADRQLYREKQSTLLAARAAVQRAEANLMAARRNPEGQLLIADAERHLQLAQNEVSGLSDQLNALSENVAVQMEDFLVELDPRFQVSNLDDSVPILLFPVKIETRFMTVKHIAQVNNFSLGTELRPHYPVGQVFPGHVSLPMLNDRKELWVRIFPDDIAVHTHEPGLTADEQAAGERYWTENWYAGPDENLQLGAWRALCSGRGSERAAWVANQTEPTNTSDKPTITVPRTNALPAAPVFPTPATKSASWTQAPESRIMPDRFVVRLYTGTQYREVVGRPVPDPLQLMMSPDGSDEFENANGDLDLPAGMKWQEDFSEAEKVGMGIRVLLSPSEAVAGFDKVLVLGVKVSANKSTSQGILESLLDNHHYTPGGLAILPQGTPTNNSKASDSGYQSARTDDEMFPVEQGAPRYTSVGDDFQKTDGQRLAEALGVSDRVVQHLQHADREDVREAMMMNTALWPATMGYYLPQLLHPVFSQQDILTTRGHFKRFVLGRGGIPAIRVDDQPYGILPATAFSKWKYNNTKPKSLYNDRLLNNILKNMERTWDGLLSHVARAGGPGNNPSATFLNIMGLHASSVEYYQRFLGGPYFLWNLFNFHQHIENSGLRSTLPLDNVNVLDFYNDFQMLQFLFHARPRIFDIVHLREPRYLNGPVIDTNPLSETRTVKEMSTDWNYIRWLAEASYLDIRDERFTIAGLPANTTPPTALLYLLLRHSCLLEYVNTGVNILADHALVDSVAFLDSEFTNIGLNGSFVEEQQGFLTAQVQMQVGLQVEGEIESIISGEFQVRYEAGQFQTMTFSQVEELKAERMSVMRQNALPDIEQRVAQALQNVALQDPIDDKTTFLEESYPAVSGSDTLLDHIESLVDAHAAEVAEMIELRNALRYLKTLPTARLERCMAEHVDMMGYRLDSWFYSLVLERLSLLRDTNQGQREGIYLGAYSWVEDLRPSSFPGLCYEEVELHPTTVVIPSLSDVRPVIGPQVGNWQGSLVGKAKSMVTRTSEYPSVVDQGYLPEPSRLEHRALSGTQDLMIDEDLLEVAVYSDAEVLLQPMELGPSYVYLGNDGAGPISYDALIDKFVPAPRINPSNLGHILAPSVNHAVTAAVLRAGYNSHKGNANSPDDAFAVNLESRRVRSALNYLEGIKNGQELAALLGYQFERRLHETNPALNQYVYELRQAFPLVAGRVTENGVGENPSDAESSNVVNGLDLLEAFRNGTWLTGLTIPINVQADLQKLILELADSLDAISDLMTSEAVYQTVMGNPIRAGAALKVMNGSSAPIDPEVIQTPRRAHYLTHRVGVLLDNSPGGELAWPGLATARSLAEPNLNRWLADRLPAPANILVRATTKLGNVTTPHVLSIADLEMQALDFYTILSQPTREGEAWDLSVRIQYHLREVVVNDDSVEVAILYMDRTGFGANDRSVYELLPYIKQLKVVLDAARPLQALDFLLDREATDKVLANPSGGMDTTALLAQLNDVMAVSMSNAEPGLDGIIAALDAAIPVLSTVADFNSPLPAETAALSSLRSALIGGSNFGAQNGYPATGSTFNQGLVTELLGQGKSVVKELKARRARAQSGLLEYGTLTDDRRKADQLVQVAEALFGKPFKAFPSFRHYDAPTFGLAQAYPDYFAYSGPLSLHEWQQSLAPVRPRMGAWVRIGQLSHALMGNPANALSVSQLPLTPLSEIGTGNPIAQWYGVQYDPAYPVPEENLSLVMQYPSGGFNATALQVGFLFDEWNEEIPLRDAEPGLAVNYNNPDGYPPQACLLAVTPEINGSWEWDDLMDTLSETLQWAKKRAVDPELLNRTPYPQVLPAVVAAMSGVSNTPLLDFGRNIIRNPQPGDNTMINLRDYALVDGVAFSSEQLSFE